jgi:Na+-transporting NADH:ubiquinone oxidoreductase subunit NqrD
MRSPLTLILLTLPSAFFLFGVVGRNLYSPWPAFPLSRWLGQSVPNFLMMVSWAAAILGIVSAILQRKTLLITVCMTLNVTWLAFALSAYVTALIFWIHNTFFMPGEIRFH